MDRAEAEAIYGAGREVVVEVLLRMDRQIQALAETVARQEERIVTPAAASRRFHEFASEWFERQKLEGGRRGGGLTAAGVADLEWRLRLRSKSACNV